MCIRDRLTKPEVGEIAEIMLKDVFKRLAIKGIQLEVTDNFRGRLVDEGYNPAYGARPLRRAVMRLLEDNLAEEVLSENIKMGDTAIVDIGYDGKVKILCGEKLEPADKNSRQPKEDGQIVPTGLGVKDSVRTLD